MSAWGAEWEIYESELEGQTHPDLGRGLEIHAGPPTDDGASMVCSFYDHMGHSYAQYPDAERNAKLICAAPQLLQSLTEMVETFGGAARIMGLDYTEAIANARKAIDAALEADGIAARKEAASNLSRAEAAEARADALERALGFYADVSKYPAPLTGGMGDLWSDCGERARAALASTGGQSK